jgi:hypothetical protein
MPTIGKQEIEKSLLTPVAITMCKVTNNLEQVYRKPGRMAIDICGGCAQRVEKQRAN